MVRAALLAVVAAAAACQGRHDDGAGNGNRSGSGSAPPIARDADAIVFDDDAAAPDGDAGAAPDDPDPPPPDPGKRIDELGAIPAWEAVVDRAQLLGRRGQHGVVYGRIGPPILMPGPPAPAPLDGGVAPDAGLIPSPYVWLIDDTDGNGALGIRVALGDRRASAGDRVALGGAWQLDDQRRWYWKVDAIVALPAAVPSDLKDPPPAAPSHQIAEGRPPAGAHTISIAKDGDAVYFQLVGPPPTTDGDGWPIADELGDKPVALLTLPGERPSYGGQDMRAPDERWQLKRAQTYWVRIGRIRRRGDDKPALIHARTAPIRVN